MGRPPKLSYEQRQQVIRAYRRYVPLRDIAKQFNISIQYISKVAKAQGLCRHYKESHSQKSRLTSTPVTLPPLSTWLGQGTLQKSEK